MAKVGPKDGDGDCSQLEGPGKKSRAKLERNCTGFKARESSPPAVRRGVEEAGAEVVAVA